MKGRNELRVNQATMMEVAQRWVDETIKSKPTVKEVIYDTSTAAHTFKLVLESAPVTTTN